MSVEFEPVKLGPRRRRVDPVAIGAVLVVLAVVVALLKPWNAGEDAGSGGPGLALRPSSASEATVSPASPSPTPAPTTTPDTRPAPIGTAGLATWARIRSALVPHDGWGIRAVVARPTGLLTPPDELTFEDVWNAVPARSDGLPTVDIEPDDQTVVAVGITFPAAHTPIDVRAWLVHPGRLEWIDTQALDANPAGGGFLYRVAGPDGSFQNWAAGRYRLDVLVDGEVHRYGFTLPNRFGFVPEDGAGIFTPTNLIDPAGGALPDLPVGLFATASGVSIPLRADDGPPLTEAGAWLDVDPGTGRAPRSRVASAFVPGATGLGVRLPPGSTVVRSSIRRLAPDSLRIEPELVPADASSTAPPHVLYRAPGSDGGVWTPGTYGISVVWTDASGRHDRSWHLELRPGPVRELPSMLLAARGFARYAGASGVVVGTAEPLEGGPRSVAIRLLHEGQATGTGIPLRDRVPCDGFRVDGLSGVVGLVGPVGRPTPSVAAHVLFEFNRSDAQPLLTATGDVPGLTLIAPVGEPPVPSDAYQVRVDDSTNPPGSSICLSLTPAG